jgi:hypothetical protein
MSRAKLNSYFYEQILGARKHQKVRTSEATVIYLSNLLTKSALDFPSKQVYLFDLYRNQEYKTLGDYTLVISGYFPESLYSRQVSVDYYIDMGITAYSSISDNSRIYKELSEEYRSVVSMLNEVSENGKNYTSDDIYNLYSLWVRTQDQDVKNKLARLGMIIGDIEG